MDIKTLIAWFEQINLAHFDGALEQPVLRFNSRLRSAAGRFIPGRRQLLSYFPPVIEIANYLVLEKDAEFLIKDTLGHEMIHYWLWDRHKPFGHTSEFWAKMKLMGVSRYNTVPKRHPPKYLYFCPNCHQEFPSRKILRNLACLKCCKLFAAGKFDVKFKLILNKKSDLKQSVPAGPAAPGTS